MERVTSRRRRALRHDASERALPFFLLRIVYVAPRRTRVSMGRGLLFIATRCAESVARIPFCGWPFEIGSDTYSTAEERPSFFRPRNTPACLFSTKNGPPGLLLLYVHVGSRVSMVFAPNLTACMSSPYPGKQRNVLEVSEGRPQVSHGHGGIRFSHHRHYQGSYRESRNGRTDGVVRSQTVTVGDELYTRFARYAQNLHIAVRKHGAATSLTNE